MDTQEADTGQRVQKPAPATVVVCEDGPVIIRGDYDLRSQTDEPIDPQRKTIALCRCGRSLQKPFCDGSHIWARSISNGDRSNRT
ncbi:CDGSH iron-sulfur domain-containing protein [Amycolatopsis decaplanina]|uniref:CDGSH iron-sulfur domain-containing protein n=1 Tax=Amycolatopsis decaplanina TaxID=208441 RepID=UPI000687CBFF|nr:CDGSH iron-sulfur domain-containing protein [Amycolatopsis decaplanina]